MPKASRRLFRPPYSHVNKQRRCRTVSATHPYPSPNISSLADARSKVEPCIERLEIKMATPEPNEHRIASPG